MMHDAKFLVRLGEALRAAEARLASTRLAMARAYLETSGPPPSDADPNSATATPGPAHGNPR